MKAHRTMPSFCRRLLPPLLMMMIGVFGVTVVTGAPLSGQEKLVNLDQGGQQSTERAKRAQEEIVFGNQQNKARVIAKKSDISSILAASAAAPQGEQDQGSEVVAHEQKPLDEDLNSRAEAASGGAAENDEKIAQAVESAMESVSRSEHENAEENEQEPSEDTEEELAKQLIVDELENREQGPEEANDVPDANDENEDVKALERAAVEQAPSEEAVKEQANGTMYPPEAAHGGDVEQFLEGLHQPGPLGDSTTLNAVDYYHRMMSQHAGRDAPHKYPIYYYRRRRSLANSKNALLTKGNRQRGRRIKRDLLDDSYTGSYNPYSAPYSVDEDSVDDLISNMYKPLSDEEADYLYKRLLNYLAENYVAEQIAPYQDTPSEEIYIPSYEPQDESYAPYEFKEEDTSSEVASPYDNESPYEPVDFDTIKSYAKRGWYRDSDDDDDRDNGDEYYPREEEKRYFYPFNDEPETHWGAFVPEKRDYGEAIQRLQRLAMALSDNPGPYYREVLEEYRRK